MIFTPHNCELILAGRKAQTRRVSKPGEQLVDGSVHAPAAAGVTMAFHTKWEVGNTYALQPGRGKHAVGRIRITDIRRELLQDITESDAIAEGFDGDYGEIPDGEGGSAVVTSRALFAHSWNKINNKPGQRWADNPAVWVIRFELVEPQQEKHHG